MKYFSCRVSATVFEIRTFQLVGYISGKAEEPPDEIKRSKNQLWVWGLLRLMHTQWVLFIL